MVSLKEAIQKKHTQAEQTLFNQRMFRGELTNIEYARYVFQLYGIFNVIERYPLPHPSLKRTTRALDDVMELTDSEQVVTYVSPTLDYINYLESLSQENLLPHVYLNYLALMFGGQLMKDKVPGSGRIYEFENTKEAMMSIRAIQKDEWADEANIALDYNIRIFDELQRISE